MLYVLIFIVYLYKTQLNHGRKKKCGYTEATKDYG